ncbi:hypothetical protein SAMN06265795_11023 [Noviherbaspirillum humi]|uniref:Uncharacterized protein n=1 Tax=Noviherbaspirillum humi TaxID=1688639 RepID=A0A239IQB6_9BURK|nr:hypothetical protein [Noviherbaspirillum humi]SNS94624.1 hypothetical protein SAMN06265795_11023 [Noviherbaspirillum humi]
MSTVATRPTSITGLQESSFVSAFFGRLFANQPQAEAPARNSRFAALDAIEVAPRLSSVAIECDSWVSWMKR